MSSCRIDRQNGPYLPRRIRDLGLRGQVALAVERSRIMGRGNFKASVEEDTRCKERQ